MSQEITNGLQKWWPALLVLILVIAVIVALFQRWNIDQLTSHPNPVKSYAEAVERIQAIQAAEASLDLNPVCQTKFLTHGEETDHTILFVHGYTNCPQQFAELGKRFYDLGYNVLIARMPHHGLADRMTDEQANLKAEELVTYTDEVVDIAQGLGRRVIIGGISLGGVMAGWAGQNRSDVDLAVVISPGFSFEDIPLGLASPIQNIFMLLPISFDWWNPALKENIDPPYAYPRYSKRVLGEAMRLGFAVQAQAERVAPLGKSILVVTNGNDVSVDNDVTEQVVQIWLDHNANLATYQFEASLGLAHDLIDPSDPNGNIELVYARLINLIAR